MVATPYLDVWKYIKMVKTYYFGNVSIYFMYQISLNSTVVAMNFRFLSVPPGAALCFRPGNACRRAPAVPSARTGAA